MNKSNILLSGKTFEIELVGPFQPNGRFEVGYVFLIKKGRSAIGGFAAAASTMVITNWKRNSPYITDGESLKRFLLRILPSIDVTFDINKFDDPNKIYFEILFTYNNTIANNNVQRFHIKGGNSPEELVEEIVYRGEVTDEKVQADMLRYLKKINREDPNPIPVEELKKTFFLDDKTFEYNLGYLSNIRRVTMMGVKSGGKDSREVTISTIGLEYLNNPQIPFQQYVHIGDVVDGDKITASTFGDNSPNIIKNSQINLNLFNQLESEIEKNYIGNDKVDLIKQTKEAHELAKINKEEDRPKILKIMGVIMSKASDIATVASLALQIYQLFHK